MLFLFPFIQHLPSLAKYFFESACSFPKRFKWRLPRRFCGQAIRPHNISTYPTQTPTFGKLELLHMWNVSQKKWLKWIRFTLIKWWLIEYTFSCWLNEKSLKRYCDKLQMTWNEWKPANKREEKKNTLCRMLWKLLSWWTHTAGRTLQNKTPWSPSLFLVF